jgi:signal transduction histidine kinase
MPTDVLVIEDDADTRANLRDILELDDHRVTEAATAAEALARDDWARYAAIILDRRLPDASAEKLLPELRRRAPDAGVIVVTGYADLQGAINAVRHGASDYILKPLDPVALRASLGRLAEHRRLHDAMEQAQRRAVQAERLAAIGQMVAGLAHESRNALQRSQACIEMLRVKLADRPDALDLVARLQNAQDHLAHLYEDVRTYSSPIQIERRICHLEDVWRDAWAQLEPDRDDPRAVLREEPAAADSRCMADPFRLAQVFRNLFENALAATTGRVVVTVRTDDLAIDGQPAVRATVRDDGPGLPSPLRPALFEPFVTTKAKGTGLGLAIAKRIIEAHGGQIAIGDGPTRGAEFLITLPRGMP